MKSILNKSNKEHSFRNKRIITGILNPIKWDRNGRVCQFSIYSENEEDIIVKDFKEVRRLEKLLNKKVTGVGIIEINNDEKYIKLHSIKEVVGNQVSRVSLLNTDNIGSWIEEYSLKVPKDYVSAPYDQFSDSLWEAC